MSFFSRFRIGLFSLIAFSSLTYASSGTAPSSVLAQELPPPNPLDLSPSWWNYYNVQGEELLIRIQRSEKQLESLKTTLSPTEEQEASPYIERIVSILQTLPALQRSSLPASTEKQVPLTAYNLQEFIQVAENLQEAEEKRKVITMQKNLSLEILHSGNVYLDTLVAAYLIESQSSFSKLLHGLEIMSERLSLLVDEFQLSYLIALEENQKILVENLESIITFARSHLLFSVDATEKIQKEIEEAKKNLRSAISHLFSMQLEFTKVHAEASSPIYVALSSQKLANAVVQENVAEIFLLRKEIERALLQVSGNSSETSITEYRKQITGSQAKINKVRRLIRDWQKNTTLDMEQALQGISFDDKEKELYTAALSLSEKTLLSLQKLENEILLSDFLCYQLDLLIQEKYPTLIDKIRDQTITFALYLQDHAQWLRESFFKIGNTPITLRAILKVVIIVILGFLLASFVERSLHRLGKKKNLMNESALYTFSRLAYFFIIFLGIVIAISSIGIDFTAFAFVAGAFTFWIGFGLLSIIQNFVSGIIVLLDRNIRVGDYIVLESGEKGIILDVNVRTTILETLEGHKVFIPNAELIIKRFTNKKISDTCHRVSIPFKIPYHADRDEISKMVIEAAIKVPYTLPIPPPQIWLTKLNGESIEAALVIWVDESSLNKKTSSLESIYLWTIDETFRKGQVSFYPAPQQT